MATPPTFADGNVAHAADLAWALDPPRFQGFFVASGGAQNAADATATIIPMDGSAYVTDGMWSNSTPNRVLINSPGVYQFTWYVQTASATYTVFTMNPRLNSFGSSTGGGSIRTHPFGGGINAARLTFERQFNAGDHVECFLTQTSGAARAFGVGNNVTGVSVRWVSYL